MFGTHQRAIKCPGKVATKKMADILNLTTDVCSFTELNGPLRISTIFTMTC